MEDIKEVTLYALKLSILGKIWSNLSVAYIIKYWFDISRMLNEKWVSVI